MASKSGDPAPPFPGGGCLRSFFQSPAPNVRVSDKRARALFNSLAQVVSLPRKGKKRNGATAHHSRVSGFTTHFTSPGQPGSGHLVSETLQNDGVMLVRRTFKA